jgi:putative addiction module component (TIGR02574 family)
MPYNKAELLALPPGEKVALAEELWSSVEDALLPITDEEVAFAEERLKLHEANPDAGLNIADFKKYFSEKHGF